MGIKQTNSKLKPATKVLRPWWDAKKGDGGRILSTRLFDTINTLENAQLTTIQGLLKNFRIYQGREELNTFTWFGAGVSGFQNGATLGPNETPKINMIKAAMQTLKSRIASDAVKVMALTDGGTYSDKRTAETLDKFGAGAMDGSGANEILPEVFNDGMWAGDGYLHVYADDSETGDWKICAEKVFPAEIIVDEAECLVTNGEPRQFYRKRVMGRSQLLAMYPTKRDIILSSQTEIANLGQKAAVEEMIVVYEAWHRRANWKAKDGRHVLAISGGTLIDEEFTKNRFPFAHYRWDKQSLGFYGGALVSDVASIQAAVTKELYIIDQALEICGMPGILTEDGSNIIFEHFSSGIGMQIGYSGTKPEIWNPPPVAQEHFQQLEMLFKKFYDTCRLSEMSATGVVQSNIKSGEGVRTQQAVESAGWKQTTKDYQYLYIDAMELHVDVARDISKKKPGFAVKSKDDRFLKSIRWSDIDLPNSKYTWKLWPTSFLGDSPEGKFDRVQELVQGGFVTPEQGLYIADFPDTKSITQYNDAVVRWTEWAVCKIFDDGEKVAILPFANYTRVIDTLQAAYLNGQMEGVPRSKLAMLQALWQQAIDKQAELTAATAGPEALAPQAGATPQGRGAMAPITPMKAQVAPAHA